MNASLPIKILAGLSILWLLKLVLLPRQRSAAPLPPGPKGKPIIGNLADLSPPGAQEWKHWLGFKKLYGPISSLTILGQTIIVLNDKRSAFDLLDKRSTIYSSRPRMTFAGEIVGWSDILAMQPYNARFRTYRKAMHRVLGSKVSTAQFYPLQDIEVRRFLLRVLESPADLIQHIRTEAGAVILKIAYGYTINPHGRDPLVDLANEAMDRFSVAASPGRWLVDTIPALKYMPEWFPGASFQRTGRAWRKTLLDVIEKPYDLVRRRMRAGTHVPSYLSRLLEGKESLTEEEELVAKWTAGALYTGGADTTVSTLSTFYLAMALHPDVQQKAHEELDRVLGPYTLPSFADRERLPYINAIVKESLRWHPVAPMGIPHLCTQDDIYEGYLIPKGAVVMVNIWSILHNPLTHPSPSSFNPSRYLTDTPEPDPATVAFGFGRRVCPGKLLAENTLYLSIAQSLAMFRVLRTEDTTVEFLPGVVSHPAPFGVGVVPRSEEHERVVRGVNEGIVKGEREGGRGDIEGLI
ncbi:cytochrome P450 [Aspergillus heteromorphus CBS 117.55]|uniref:Cytochrome P450 n=1 Tax=Aspergillus heteromorphus CBS 117.55 TaxID=1448321 RepID=A0A317WVA9_9EURO|nr:cytochrome P450 [Aspergillus heteromorphus CBS 117.55]PWY89157.1 cytochrome P450 [Aspergillus heteromorphus CBS 117.55]